MATVDTDPFAEVELGARLSDCSNVLLETPAVDSTAEAACIDLLTVSPPPDAHVLNITLLQSPDDCLDAWRAHAGEQLPAAMDVISVGDAPRSTAMRDACHRRATTLTRETVSNPGDLTGLGIEITKALQRWQRDTVDVPLYGCFHSVTTLMQYADLQRTFRFLHALTTQVSSSGAVVHYHLTPDAHDPRTRSTLRTLFDLVIGVDADGTVTVGESR